MGQRSEFKTFSQDTTMKSTAMKLLNLFLYLTAITALVILCHQIISNAISNQENNNDYDDEIENKGSDKDHAGSKVRRYYEQTNTCL